MTMPVKPFFLDLTDSEIDELTKAFGDILRSGQLILSKYTQQFEDEFAAYVGCKHAVSMNTATSVLEFLCTVKGGHGKRIAVASNTNFASVAAIIRAGAEPVFLDMTSEFFVPSLSLLQEAHEKHAIDGVMWVHIGGIISPDIPEVAEYCRRHGIFLIEDAAHAHGSRMQGQSAGNFGDGGAFSFFPTKVMTTMEGGMLTTNSKADADLAKSFRNQGKRHAAYGGLHYDLGNSWRMSEISARMGLIQLAKLDEMVRTRNRAAARLGQTLDAIGIPYCSTAHMDQASQYKFIVRLPPPHSAADVKKALESRGIICGGGVYEVPCHLQPVFKDVSCDKSALQVTEAWCPQHICPPITSGTTDEQSELICQTFREVLG